MRDGCGTDAGWTDGRTEWNQYTPQQLCCAEGIIMQFGTWMRYDIRYFHMDELVIHANINVSLAATYGSNRPLLVYSLFLLIPGACWNIWYPYETNFKPKLCEILFASNLFLCCPIIKKFNTVHGSSSNIAMRCVKFHNDWTINLNIIDDWDFTRLNLRWVSECYPILPQSPEYRGSHVSH